MSISLCDENYFLLIRCLKAFKGLKHKFLIAPKM